jgi:hypothetical protein
MNGKAPPLWCGRDRWTYSQGLIDVQTKTKIVPSGRRKGWVNNGTLVFQSDDKVTLLFGNATLSFGTPITAGKLFKKPDGNWRLEATLAGRIPIKDMLTAAGSFDDPGNGTLPDGGPAGFCRNNAFTDVRKILCDAVDINASSSYDFRDGFCDAISSAVNFEAEQAAVDENNERTEDPRDRGCGTDNQLFTCP